MGEFTCPHCGLNEDDPPQCPEGVPEALWKSMFDDFDYMLGLRNGHVFQFGKAIIDDTFVHLNGIGAHNIRTDDTAPTFDRGLDVRLSDILWVADAPHGS